MTAHCLLRVRVEIMGPGKYEHVGESQSVLIMINPIIFTHTRNRQKSAGRALAPARWPSEPGGPLILCGAALAPARRARPGAVPVPLAAARRRGGALPPGRGGALWLGAAAVASFLAAVLTEIHLCDVCSCQEILRRNGRGQACARLAPPLRTAVGLDKLRLGLLSRDPLPEVAQRALAMVARAIVQAGGTVVCAGTVVAPGRFIIDLFEGGDDGGGGGARLDADTDEVIAPTTLGYGQSPAEPGLHVMQTSSAHYVENLTGKRGASVLGEGRFG
jgi:hypothetical protein